MTTATTTGTGTIGWLQRQLPKLVLAPSFAVVLLFVYGFGWGLAGFCPGPALVALGAGFDHAAAFVAAMLGGMALYALLERRFTAR